MGIIKKSNNKITMGKTCCLCLPITCGCITLAIFTFIGAIVGVFTSVRDQAYWETFWPMVITSSVMCVIWVSAIMSSGFRRFAAHMWLILMVIGCCGWYTYTIISGDALNYVCSETNIINWNNEADDINSEHGKDVHITKEDCTKYGKWVLIADCALRWVFYLYFAYVIMRWSNKY